MINPHDLITLAKEGPLEVRCHRCKRLLSEPLSLLTDPTLLKHEDNEQMLPPRSIAPASILLADTHGNYADVDPSDILVSRIDLLDVKNDGNVNGCCGPDGLDGPNLCCSAGHFIGTEDGDCWQWHIVFLKSNWVDICPLAWNLPRT